MNFQGLLQFFFPPVNLFLMIKGAVYICSAIENSLSFGASISYKLCNIFFFFYKGWSFASEVGDLLDTFSKRFPL